METLGQSTDDLVSHLREHLLTQMTITTKTSARFLFRDVTLHASMGEQRTVMSITPLFAFNTTSICLQFPITRSCGKVSTIVDDQVEACIRPATHHAARDMPYRALVKSNPGISLLTTSSCLLSLIQSAS
jgi:hypothetical protein